MSDIKPGLRNETQPGVRSKKKLGVVGGMGPAATAYFYELLTTMADAGADQEHIETFIISRPTIPDRTAFIMGKSDESPVPQIIESGRMLAVLGAELIAIPCVTTHFFFEELASGIEVPLINVITEMAEHLLRTGVKRAGLMATDGTISSRLFDNELESRGIRSVVPSERMQALVMDLIYNRVKANKPCDINEFIRVADELRENGAEAIVLACTELSLIKRDFSLIGGYVDALEVLAGSSLELCGGAVRAP